MNERITTKQLAAIAGITPKQICERRRNGLTGSDLTRPGMTKSQAGRKGASRSPWRHNLSLSGSRPDFAKANKRGSE